MTASLLWHSTKAPKEQLQVCSRCNKQFCLVCFCVVCPTDLKYPVYNFTECTPTPKQTTYCPLQKVKMLWTQIHIMKCELCTDIITDNSLTTNQTMHTLVISTLNTWKLYILQIPLDEQPAASAPSLLGVISNLPIRLRPKVLGVSRVLGTSVTSWSSSKLLSICMPDTVEENGM